MPPILAVTGRAVRAGLPGLERDDLDAGTQARQRRLETEVAAIVGERQQVHLMSARNERAQLVDTASGEILWSEKVDVPAQDLITVQDKLAERVVAGLRLTLTPEEQAKIEHRPTRSGIDL